MLVLIMERKLLQDLLWSEMAKFEDGLQTCFETSLATLTARQDFLQYLQKEAPVIG